MHVTLVSTPPETTSGTGQYTDALGDELADDDGVTHEYLPLDGANPIPFVSTAIRAGDGETDVVHVQFDYVLFGPLGLYTLLVFPLLWLRARRQGFALVVTMHEALNGALVTPPLAPLKALYARLINRLIARTADGVVFLSGEAEDRFEVSVGDGPFHHIPHGADRTETREMDTADAKRAFGYGAETRLVVEPGYVSPRKGSDLFLSLARRCPDVEFLLAGGPPRERHTAFFESIRGDAPPNLRVTGHLDDDRFHAAFVAADLVVLPYNETEQTGIVNAVNQSGVFNWCAAYGVPVLASDCAHFRSLHTEWDAVWLFDPADLDDAAQRLRRLLDDEAERARLASTVERYAREHSLSAAADEHRTLYRRVTR
ncbi:glycosyltransferase family 4 protein [Haloarcula litorea]|uniref:glycosyltransferase family 4 protein n=1 Tax=Haloarcula litorea TaxID=3032579 RepID=UPI0023E7FEDE|nr:glycosyltransferase family 4 protein [Halomicroarcula sp. GDY20]